MLPVCGAALILGTVLLARFGMTSRTTSERREYRTGEFRILAGLVLLGLILRMPRLLESLWYDEIAAWMDYGMRGPGWIVGTYFDPANHILHTLLTWGSVELLGFDGLALRFPALACSLAAIIPIYGIARLATGATRPAIIAGPLAAVWPVAVLEGVEARGYSLMILASALSSWLLLSACRDPKPCKWFVYAVCCALGAWAHFTTVFVPIGHGVWQLCRILRHREHALCVPALTALGLAAVLTIALYAPVLPQMLEIRNTFTAADGDEPGVLGTEGLHALLQLGGAWSWWAASAGLALFGFGFARSLRHDQGRGVMHMTLLGLPVLILVVALAGSWMYARFTLFALPGAMLTVAIGVEHLWTRRSAIGVVAITVLLGLAATDLATRPPKQPLRDAVEHVRASMSPRDRVLAIGLAHRVLEVYAGELDLYYALRHGAQLDTALAQGRPRWVILYYPRSVREETYAVLREEGFVETRRFRGWVDWDNGDVVIFEHRR